MQVISPHTVTSICSIDIGDGKTRAAIRSKLIGVDFSKFKVRLRENVGKGVWIITKIFCTAAHYCFLKMGLNPIHNFIIGKEMPAAT